MTTTPPSSFPQDIPADRRERIELLTEELDEALTEFKAEKHQAQAGDTAQEPASRRV